MSYNVLGPGPTIILTSSSSGAGDWYRVHDKLGTLTFQVLHIATSVGASISSTTVIEVSNDGTYPLDTVAGSIVLAGASQLSDGFATNAAWGWVRAKINSLGATTAGSTGSTFNVSVRVSAQLRS